MKTSATRAVASMLVLLCGACAPQEIPPPVVGPSPAQIAQREQLSRLTSDLGAPEKVRAQMGAVAAVLGVASTILIQSPTAAKDPTGLQITEKALIGQQQRLNAVALSKTDDELIASVAELCTPDALSDAQAAGGLMGGVAAVNPSKKIANDDDKLDNFRRNQRIYEQCALYLIQIQTRCARNSPPTPPTQTASQAPIEAASQVQDEEAPPNTAVLTALLAASITAPVDAIEK